MKNNILLFVLIISFFNSKGQNNKTTFGLQYKPIIPSKYFNSSNLDKSLGDYNFNLSPNYSNSFGMILRHTISKNFSLESGLNYIQRNYTLSISYKNLSISDITTFALRSYEIPVQFLTYVRASEFWYLNVAFGLSHNVLASDIYSSGESNKSYSQKTYRKNGGYRALLANVGMEYRTNENGQYYIGASLHRPWSEISRIFPQYNDENNENNFYIDIYGSFVTIDFRYFFEE